MDKYQKTWLKTAENAQLESSRSANMPDRRAQKVELCTSAVFGPRPGLQRKCAEQ